MSEASTIIQESNKLVHTRKYIPFKLLAYLLYNNDPLTGILERRPDGTLLLRTGPLARSLKTTPSRLGAHLKYLKQLGLLTDIQRERQGLYVIGLVPPINMGMY